MRAVKKVKGKKSRGERVGVLVLAVLMVLGLLTSGLTPVQAANTKAGAIANTETDLTQKWNDCVDLFEWTDTTGKVDPAEKWTQGATTAVTAVNGVYDVKTAAEFLWALQSASVSSITLSADLDMGGSGGKEDSSSPLWPSPGINRDLKIDGQGHTVYNVKGRSTGTGWAGSIGLIGLVKTTAKFELSNLNCESLNLSSTGLGVGLVAGNGPWNGAVQHPELVIENCSVEKALLVANDSVGALFGGCSGFCILRITNSYSKNIYVKAPCRLGGLLGVANSGTIENCYSIESVMVSPTPSSTADYKNHAGGFMGMTNGSMTFNNCFTNNSVYSASTAGGFIGFSNVDQGSTSGSGTKDNKYTNCYAIGMLEGTKNIGGFVGVAASDTTTRKNEFVNCYATSMVGMLNGGSEMGGFAGAVTDTKAIFTDCYAAGEVGSLDTNSEAFAGVGGFAGSTAGTYTNCIYDKQTTAMKGIGGGSGAGVIPKSTHEITGHVAEGDETGALISDGFDPTKWTIEAGMYPQIKAFSDPAAAGFSADRVDLIKAYSLASASTVFLRDEATSEMPENYDTVRDILDLFSFTSKAKNPDYGYKWEVDPAHYDSGEKDIYSAIITDKKTPVLSFDPQKVGSDDRIINMAPGIGWAKVSAAYTGVDGKTIIGSRALRIVPTTTVSLGIANPDMGIGSDVRLYPDIDTNKRYRHQDGVKLIRTNASDLNQKPPLAPYGDYPGTNYKAAVVELEDTDGFKPRGTMDVTIEKYDHTQEISEASRLNTDVVPDDVDSMTEAEKTTNAKYRDLFNGTKDFSSEDYGIYVLTYTWTVDNVVLKNSKKLYVLPPTTLTYSYNDSDEATGGAEDIYKKTNHRLNEKVGTADDYQNATFKLADGPSRAGYDFVGWSTRAAATKESYLANADGTSLITDYELKANTVAYAVWQVRDYTLTFHADDLGAFGMTEDTTLSDITYGKTIAGTAGAVYPAVPVVGQVDTEANKIFLGWSTMNPDDLPKDETDKQVGQAANFTADTPIDITGLKYSDYYGYFKDELGDQQTVIDLYPVLKNNTATVRFYQNDSTENGGKGAQLGTDITLTYGDPSPQAPAAVHDGYILRGWSAVDKEDFEPGAGKSYTSEYDALAAFDGEKDSYEWIAVWERAHTVTLMNNYSKEDSTKTEVPMIEDGTALGDKLMILSRDGYSFKGWSTVREALVPNTEAKTPITKANTTLYAVWSTIPYSVTLYQNNSPEDTAVVKTITDQIWGSTLTPEELQVPTRAGYTFGGYNTARDGKGIDFIAKTDQAEGTKITADTALYAKWSKNPYILNVYKTPVIGAIPDQIITGIPYGEAIGDKFPTAAKYYTNAAGEKYVFGGFMDHTGKLVTAADSYAIGDLASDMGTLMAQYKTRAYDITGTKSGHGSIFNLGTYTRGDNPLISWQADIGYKISQIMIDGKVRDDLIGNGKSGSQSFLNLDNNHSVNVTFVEDDGSGDSADPDAEYYTVTTTKIGGAANTENTMLTGTQTVLAQKDHTVSWEARDGYHITQILVDGAAYPVTNPGSIVFEKIGQDHHVMVTYKSDVPDFEKGSTPGFWTVMTRQSGGDPKGIDTTLTPTNVVRKNSDHTVSWTADKSKGYTIESIILDKGTKNEKILNAEEIRKGSYSYTGIDRDHTVDIHFKNETQEEPVDKYLKVETKLVGGPGEITGSAAVKAGEDYTVNWHLPESITRPDSETYNHYIIDKVVINGEIKTPEEMQNAVFTDIEADKKVVVVLKPNLRQVDTDIIGGGRIDPSATLFYGQKYTVQAVAAAGYYLAETDVDGVITTYLNPENSSARSLSFADQIAQETTVLIDNEKIIENHHVKATFLKMDGTLETTGHKITTKVEGGKGSITPGSSVETGGSAAIEWTIDSEFVIDHVSVSRNGQMIDYPLNADGKSINISDIADDYEIVVTLKPGDGTETPEDKIETYTINTAITGGAGASITPTLQHVNEGLDKTITWSYQEDIYSIETIVIDGSQVDLTKIGKSYTFRDIKGDHNIIVTLKLKEEKPDPPIDPPVEPSENTYTISTAVAGGDGGTIDDSRTVKQHTDYTVNWTVNEGYQMNAIIVDGIVRDDLRTGTSVTFLDIITDHQVIILLGKIETNPPEIPAESYVVSTSKEGEGTITDTTGVKAGENHTVKFKAKPGYHVVRVSVDGISQPDFVEKGAIHFEKMSNNHHVNVIFEADKPVMVKEYSVSIFLEDGRGTVSASGTVRAGDSYTFNWQPETGWYTQSVIINGEAYPELLGVGKYTLKDINSDQQVRIIFAQKADNGGTDKPEDNIKPTEKWKAIIGSMAPYTGMTGDSGHNLQNDMARYGLENGKAGNSGLAGFLSDLFGGKGGGAFQKSEALSIVDLCITALALLLCTANFILGRKAKIAGMIISGIIVYLFFTTQPMLLQFVWMDGFTPLFLLFIGVQAGVFLVFGKREKRGQRREIKD